MKRERSPLAVYRFSTERGSKKGRCSVTNDISSWSKYSLVYQKHSLLENITWWHLYVNQYLSSWLTEIYILLVVLSSYLWNSILLDTFAKQVSRLKCWIKWKFFNFINRASMLNFNLLVLWRKILNQ